MQSFIISKMLLVYLQKMKRHGYVTSLKSSVSLGLRGFMRPVGTILLLFFVFPFSQPNSSRLIVRSVKLIFFEKYKTALNLVKNQIIIEIQYLIISE